uniref:Diguanylate cyclase DosC n=1 Tax=Magnetococcus massalia (strain MO-1) TaxID=451514 RepID=A0A1S7LGG5_MAGMO|nr:Putative Diguanylate cyclase yddV [Candidatus Magnetococcus massalia]
MESKDIQLLRELLTSLDDDVRCLIHGVISPKANQIAQSFYEKMLSHPESARFLTHEKVDTHLKRTMTIWIQQLVSCQDDGQIEPFIHHQIEIGDKHARINIPLVVMTMGTMVLKQALFRLILESDIPGEKMADAIILLDQLIDLSMAVMNRVYISDMMTDAKDQQALKLQSLGIDMALQTEGLRSSLFDWHRQVLGLLMDVELTVEQMPSIRRTNFGLWVLHKGELLFPGSEEIENLKDVVKQIDESFKAAFKIRSDGWTETMRDHLHEIDHQVTRATTVLDTMTQRTMAMEGGRDPLTKLFNRRFLRTILQREVRSSINSEEQFAIMLIDLDHFKQINDQHGHDAGDAVLRQLAEILVSTIRAGDFAFRYGGEEFLVVINAVKLPTAEMVAEKIRATIASHPFAIGSDTPLHVTASIGVALYDGHPDYHEVISQSDTAVYQAKNSGRNQVVFYQKPSQ